MHTTTPAEWIACLSLGISLASATATPYFLFVDTSLADFDPRPALARLVASGRLDPLLIVAGPAWVAVRDAVLDAAALLILLTTSPKGAMA